MIKKIITITISLIIIITNSIVSNATRNESKTNVSEGIEVVYITVGQYSNSGKIAYDHNIYHRYMWIADNKLYYIYCDIVTDLDILKGKLTIEKYDLLYLPWNEANEKNIKMVLPSIKNFIWKNKVEKYVRTGGGVIGYCAPAYLLAKTKNRPDSFIKSLVYKNTLDVSQVELISNYNLPFFAQLKGKPENIGQSAYFYYRGQYIPLDIRIDRNNPIFKDCFENTRRIAWCAGPALGLPEDLDHNIKPIAYFPEEEISDNKSTQLHAWKYNGKLKGYFEGFIKSLKFFGGQIYGLPGFMGFAEDWEKTDKIIETHLANQPFMTMETYPNENKARIILCGGHPEALVLFGGNIREVDDTDSNSLIYGLYYYDNYSDFYNTPEDEFSYNWWIVRRNFAWVSKKVPDNHLPPVFGPSQVCDIYPYNQTDKKIIILGNTEYDYNNITLDLFYRFSNDNKTWSKWLFYDTDYNVLNGWSWEFIPPEIPAHYQFYSIRKHKNENIWINETTPPGPDAICYFED